jgi:hypothetical protein
MTDEQFEAWAASLTIAGDQAFLPGEQVPAEYRRDLYQRGRLAGMPKRDRRAYKAEWQKRHRAKLKARRAAR